MMGRIAAGRPLEAVEEHETLSLGEFARSDKTFVLQVKGSSMIDDHILNGDYVVIEPTQVANPGEIVVALVGNDEATLKRFYRESGGKIRLQPANSEMAPIIVAGRRSEDSGARRWSAAQVLISFMIPNDLVDYSVARNLRYSCMRSVTLQQGSQPVLLSGTPRP